MLEMLPTVDPDLGALVRAALQKHGVDLSCSTHVDAIQDGNQHRRTATRSAPANTTASRGASRLTASRVGRGTP